MQRHLKVQIQKPVQVRARFVLCAKFGGLNLANRYCWRGIGGRDSKRSAYIRRHESDRQNEYSCQTSNGLSLHDAVSYAANLSGKCGGITARVWQGLGNVLQGERVTQSVNTPAIVS